MYALLRSVFKLKNLTVLSLPPLADGFGDPSLPGHGDMEWPPSLTRMHFTGVLPHSTNWWQSLTRRWPETLKTLAFHDCRDYGAIDRMRLNSIAFPQITSVRVDGDRNDHSNRGNTTLFSWASVFPSLRSLSVPSSAMDIPDDLLLLPMLERLEVTSRGDGEKEPDQFTNSLLLFIGTHVPSVWQVRLRGTFPEFDEAIDVDYILKRRLAESNAAVGKVIQELETSAGIFYDDE